jgi:hypothetical protein
LTFKNPVRKETAIEQLRYWNRRLCKQESIQTAFIAVLNYTNWTPHVHVLMFGINRNGKNLLNISTKNWQLFWADMERSRNRLPRRAVIEWVTSNQRASQYLAHNMTPWNPEKYELVLYNQKLLAKNQLYVTNRSQLKSQACEFSNTAGEQSSIASWVSHITLTVCGKGMVH